MFVFALVWLRVCLTAVCTGLYIRWHLPGAVNTACLRRCQLYSSAPSSFHAAFVTRETFATIGYLWSARCHSFSFRIVPYFVCISQMIRAAPRRTCH